MLLHIFVLVVINLPIAWKKGCLSDLHDEHTWIGVRFFVRSPGEAAMAAAVNPADGPWLYYVTVNPDSGETKFTDDYDEFLGFKAELTKWLADNPQ